MLNRLAIAIVLAWGYPALAADPAPADTAPAPEAEEKAQSMTVTSDYVHGWKKFPQVLERRVDAPGQLNIKAQPGRVTVIYFLSSHCLPCQRIMERYLRIVDRFRDLHTDFYYVFLNDTVKDATGFTKEYGLQNAARANLSSRKYREAFHAQTVPMIYVGDRHGWLATRYPMTYGNAERIGDAELDDLENLLLYLTSY